jgi:hypothetical protein
MTARLTICLFALLVATTAPAQTPSALWGESGERWSPTSRLPDFSFAGYHRGESPLPTDLPVHANVRDFGAAGDGKHDDTPAFRKAMDQTPAGVIQIPPGRYLITDILDIRKPNLVLRGAGPDKTTLYFPNFLEDVRPNPGATTSGEPTSNYSWSGGFVWVRGSYQSSDLAPISAPARRGDTTLSLRSTDALKVGQEIEIRQDDNRDNSLATYLYAGNPGPVQQLKGRTRASFTARVLKLTADSVTLDRALPFDLQLRWKPRIVRFQPTVTETGIENLRFEFPNIPYAGHFTEKGHNAIAFTDVAHCWVRNVVIDDCDSGIFFGGRYCTAENVTYHSARKPWQKTTGHHGFEFSGDDNLLTHFRFETRFVHDITVERCARNVIASGGGVDLCFDHHKYADHANLFTDIDAGEGTRLWRCGGGADLGKNSGAWETFWNVRARRPQSWPPPTFAPDPINLVGVQTDGPSTLDPAGKWFEAIPPKNLTPQDLHESQLRRRLGH